jgi:CRP-like cAMP-binding protein
MTDAAYERLAALVETQDVGAGTAITRQGEEADAFYVIAAGTADVRRDDRSVASLRAGDFFGEIALIDGQPRTASVIAIDDMALLRLSRAAFLRLIDEQPAARLGILMALTERIRRDAPQPTD